MTHAKIPSVSDLKRLFAERGVRPSKGLGQHFLVEPRLMDFIVSAAELERDDVVLEPGAGTGGLTALLASRAGVVVAVEVDRKLCDAATERLAEFPNVHLIRGDAMAKNGKPAAQALKAVNDALAASPRSRFKVVGNLPYSISTALISALLSGEPIPEEMVLTVQREVADRICSPAGSKSYGYFSVLVQSLARVSKLKRLSPRVFWPQPEVESCIVRIRPDAQQRAIVGDIPKLRRIASALFTHRRKQAAKVLHSAGLAETADQARRLLAAAGVSETTRAEQIRVDQFVKLTHLITGLPTSPQATF